MEWTPFNLQHRDVLNTFLGQCNQLSNINYTNFILWDHVRHYQIARSHQHLCIRYQDNNGKYVYFYPLTMGDTDQALIELTESADHQALCFDSITAEQAAHIRRMQGVKVVDCHNPREQADYIYLIDNLIDLPGQAYRRQRNFCTQFDTQNDASYMLIDRDNLSQARSFLSAWFTGKSSESLQNEWLGLQRLLDNYDKTHCIGGMLLVNGCVVALTIGEQLNADTVVIHTEKADTAYRGAYQAINRAYLQQHWQHMTYVNRQQDLGLEGLRKAKLSYHPIAMVEKITMSVSAASNMACDQVSQQPVAHQFAVIT